MTELLPRPAIGASPVRRDGELKVKGLAAYAYEHDVERPLYLYPIQAPIARGRVTAVDAEAAAGVDGVVAVITHENAPRLASDENRELWILQDPEVHFRGQFVGGVVADSLEVARETAGQVRITYEQRPHDVVLRPDHPELYAPEKVNPNFPTDTSEGDVEAALAAAPVVVEQTYTTPLEFHNPMEPHAAIAIRHDEGLTIYDSSQGVGARRQALATLLGLDPEQVRVISPYVGGGFGSKGETHAHIVLAVLGAMTVPGRAVKVALTRQQMFGLAGHRTPTVQRVRLGADRDGRLQAISHEVLEETGRIKEFAEQTATPTRLMYAAPHRRTSHRLAPLDLPPPTWMRAPGEAPGMFAPEVAMDELAERCDLDPVELRIRNEPEIDPETGNPWSTRRLVECLREGAEQFGWERRDPRPGARRDGEWLVGLGVASATYPVKRIPGSAARIAVDDDGVYTVQIASADMGQGTWTSLAQIAADALEVELDQINLEIGDTQLPPGSVAGGSSGTTSWGSAIVAAARELRERHGSDPPAGAEVTTRMPSNPDAERFAMHAFGAQFAEVRVHVDTAEIRVPRLLAVYDAGTIINPRLAESQLRGGMIWGLSMALHEHAILDTRLGHVVTHDLAEYHVPVCADVVDVEVHWLDGHDPHTNPMGSKGIGEIGITGVAAAISNGAYNATGIRVRDLPVTADKLLR